MAVPDTIYERIHQAARTWIKAAVSLSDQRIIPADDKGPRPAVPYLTVKVVAGDVPVGVDEDLGTIAAELTVINSAPTGTTYTATIQSEIVSYTRVASDASDSDVAAKLAEAIEAAVELVTATSDGAVVFVVSQHGTLSVSETDANLSLVSSGAPAYVVGGQRRATLSLQGFGRETAAWLEAAAIGLRRPSIRALINAEGLSVRAVGGTTDLAQFLDSSIEARFLREFEIDYALRSRAETATVLEEVEAEVTLDKFETDPDALVVDLSIPAVP